jgi:methylthioribulose-1-phosphate dehydratase
LKMSRARKPRQTKGLTHRAAAAALGELGRQFHERGWVLGTSGNFSITLSHAPLRLAITSTGVDKGLLGAKNVVEVDAEGKTVRGSGQASNETLLHLTLVRWRGAGAVLHTHSIWSTLVSELCFNQRGVRIEGYEMLKGLRSVHTHDYAEWLPIIDNSQDMPALAKGVEAALKEHPESHGFLLRRHGLYTWGDGLAEAKRHVEILEFLLEITGRRSQIMAQAMAQTVPQTMA